MGEYPLATKCYEQLLRRNQENTLYYLKIKEAKQLNDDECVYNMLCGYRKKFPKALAPKRLCLTFASGIYILLIIKLSLIIFILHFRTHIQRRN